MALFKLCHMMFDKKTQHKQVSTITIVLTLLSMTTLGMVLITPFQKALAHVSNEYGNITIQVGWDQEPPLVDEINNLVIGVTRDLANGSSIPVRNALADMNIMAKYGGVTKALDFVPSQEQEGWYEAKILPTRIGSYNVALNGTIHNQPISDEVQIEDVESTEKISFPEATDSGVGVGVGVGGSTNGATNTNPLNGQISNILNQITNDVNNIRNDIETLAESNSNIQEGIQNVKDIADRSYLLAVTAIGVGAAGNTYCSCSSSSNSLILNLVDNAQC
jgi:predicted PurR-regulated permease PerM